MQQPPKSSDFPKKIIESTDGYEKYIREFLSGRKLYNIVEKDQKQREEHERKYEKELEHDKKDQEKGKEAWKIYREMYINPYSKCDNKFVNNLQSYYGDGSNLKGEGKQHYAMDFVISQDTETSTRLKQIEVPKKSDSVKKWIRESRNRGKMATPLRRSFSCCRFYDLIDDEQVYDEKLERRHFDREKFYTIANLDENFQFPAECDQKYDEWYYQEVSTAMSTMISRVNAPPLSQGDFDISRVLFSNQDEFAYVIPRKIDIQAGLRQFSGEFSAWFEALPDDQRKCMGVDSNPEDHRNRPYYKNVNVVLFLEQFEAEGTQFRRARHVCYIRGKTTQKELYLEIDSGELRAVETTPQTVRRLPQQWALHPTPIVEVRFHGAQTAYDVEQRIAEIRRSKKAVISYFYTGNRVCDFGNRKHFPTRNALETAKKRPEISNVETAILRPRKLYRRAPIYSLFCDDPMCMGMCGMRKYFEEPPRTPIAPSTPSMTSSAPWLDEDEEEEPVTVAPPPARVPPRKFQFPPPAYRLEPVLPSDNFFKNF